MSARPRAAVAARSLLALSACLTSLAMAHVPAARAITIRPEQAGIPNFGQVNEHYFRGGQPTREALARLDSLGVRTVIDLQNDGPADERTWVEHAGMQYFRIPLSSNRPATEAQTAQFLQLVDDARNWPVYVHCAGGRHRTGEMTAIYRIAHDGWTADRAFAEMKEYDWYSFPFHGPLKGYVYSYYGTFRTATTKPAAPTDTSAGPATSVVADAPTTP